ncbi:MAG: hypothetical protein RI897_2891 [Verrucomicrobiota bacterium]
MSKMDRIVLAGLSAGVWMLVAGCSQGGAGGQPPETPVEVVLGTPQRMPVEDLLTAVGSLEANERVDLRPEAPGVVVRVGFEEGEAVSVGQSLFELDASKEAAAAAQARAELELARSNYERAKTLAGTRAISQQELDRLSSEMEVKSAALQVREEDLADRKVVAPFAGVTGPRLVSPGQYVNAGALLGTLVDSHQIKVRCGVPERSLALVRTGQHGRIRVNTYPDRWFEGVVDLISPVVDESTRTAEVRLRVQNEEGLLRPGMFARVEIVMLEREQALVIPEGALVPSMQGFSVYSVKENRVALVPVEVGVRMPGKVEVAGGLSGDERLVMSGTQKLVEGMLVKGEDTGAGTAGEETQP